MRNRPSLPLILGVSLFGAGLMACGGDDNADAAEEVGDGDGDTSGDGDGDPSTGDGDGDPATGDGDGDGDATGDGDGDATGDGDGDPTTTGDGDGDPGDCMVWEITYDLTGSEFEISMTPFGAGDQVNTVMEPYDANDHVGPGNFVLRFQDVNGEPGGQAFMYSYDMSLHFVIESFGATVATDLETDAGPVDCGITSGALNGTTVAWMPSAIVDNHSVGQILCNGNLCGAGGLPNGQAVPQDDTSDMPIDDFVFNNDLTSFTMAKTVIEQEANVKTVTWMYEGTEVTRELVAAPACLCQ